MPMFQDQFKRTLKLLVILSPIAALSTLALVLTIPARGYQGFGMEYNFNTQSNPYFTAKYQTEACITYGIRFIAAILAFCSLLAENILVFRIYPKQKELQQNRSDISFSWFQRQFDVCYLLFSVAVLFLTPVFSFYLSLIVENRGNQGVVPFDCFIILGESLASFALAIVSWVLIFRYSLYGLTEGPIDAHMSNLEQKPKSLKYEQNQQSYFKRLSTFFQKSQKPLELKSTFDMQGASEIYESIKTFRQVQKQESPFYSNPAIPLYHEFMNSPNTLKKERSERQIKSDSKKIGSPNKADREKSIRNSLQAEIQRRKKRFRELNPVKEHIIQELSEENEQSDYDETTPKLTNLPKTYRQYMKQSRRPLRKGISIQYLPEAPSPLEEKLTNHLINIQKKQNLNEKVFLLKDKSGRLQGDELTYEKISRGARERKPLFILAAENVNDNQFQKEINVTQSKKEVKRRKSTKQEDLIEMLKRKYTSGGE